jgi:hypothetical protein
MTTHTWTPFNINHHVKVKFTEIGLARHRELHDQYSKFTQTAYMPPRVDADGYSELQLWCLMQNYGDLCGLGFQVPFETTILISDEQ